MPFRAVHPLASFLARAGLGSALMLSASPPLAYAGARAVVGPSEAAPTVAVDTSEIPDFEPSLAQQLSVDAAKQAEDFGFDPSQITITIVWLDAASASYGIHIYIETKDAKLSDGPRGPMLNRCEQCSEKRVPEAAVEALVRGFELYEHTLKAQRKSNQQDEEQRRMDQERNRQALATAEHTIGEQEEAARKLKRRRAAAIVLLSLGGVVHAAGITLMAIWRTEQPAGVKIEVREFYVPGMVLLSLSPAPIAAGAVYLADYTKAKKKQRATPSLISLPRGLGLGTTVRF